MMGNLYHELEVHRGVSNTVNVENKQNLKKKIVIWFGLIVQYFWLILK